MGGYPKLIEILIFIWTLKKGWGFANTAQYRAVETYGAQKLQDCWPPPAPPEMKELDLNSLWILAGKAFVYISKHTPPSKILLC